MAFDRQGIFLNAVMLAAVTAVVAAAIQRFVPTWQPGYLVAACFLVALEAGIMQMIFRAERMWLAELARYLVPELTVMLVLMRIAATLSQGSQLSTPALAAIARRWLYDPLSIFDMLFLCFILAGLIVGGLAHTGMNDLLEIAPQPFEGPARDDEGSRRHAVLAAADRALALRRISSRFVVGGVLLLCALGIEAVNIERIGGPSHPISGLSAGGALLYLVSGFLLYSQARLALLHARWRLEGVHVADDVARRWTRASLMLIGGVVGAALALPRAYGLGLLDTLRAVLGLLGYALVLLGYVVIWIFSLLALIPVLLIALFSSNGSTTPPTLPRFVPPDAPPPVVHEPHLLPALIFWMCMFILVGYAFWIVGQRHPGLLRALTTRGPLAWLLDRLGWLWRDSRAWAGQATARARELLRRRGAIPKRRIPALRLGRLPPRELVLYFYRSTVRRAVERGLRRRGGQTPYEYRATLIEHLPEVEQDIGELTEAFVVAQYSPRPIDDTEARRARRPWERVRRRLQALNDRRPTTDDRRPTTDDEGRV
jgi:Domain of unknown function (DUF4129)